MSCTGKVSYGEHITCETMSSTFPRPLNKVGGICMKVARLNWYSLC